MSEPTISSPGVPFVIEATRANFEQEVIERSRSVPVVVDFWAPWCGPCRLLGPVLEKLAQEYAGRFILAKVDTDRDPEVAAPFGVRSIPVVFGLRGGEVLDSFVGVQPENAIRAWIDRLLPTRAETLVAEGRHLELSDPATAQAKYGEALSLDADSIAAQTGLARIALEQGRLEEASARIASMERSGFLESEAEKVKAELTLHLQAQHAGSVESARAAEAASPDDPLLKLQLAEALAASGQYADALALCLALVERGRKGVREEARQTMVAIFQLLPAGSDLVAEYQRRLSVALAD
jgi:putative thioredoxin